MSLPTTTCLAGGATSNPLLEPWTTPFSLPPFDKIKVDHYKPALKVGMEEHLKDLQAIVDNADPPTFENVMVAYDRAGSTLDKVGGVFGNMCSSQNTPELQAIQTEMSPILSRHRSATFTLPGLFEKVETVYHQMKEDPSYSGEDLRLTERIYLDFTRSGAHFDTEKQQENADIVARLASLITEFSQNGESYTTRKCFSFGKPCQQLSRTALSTFCLKFCRLNIDCIPCRFSPERRRDI